ncbi:hypothetical protein Sps_03491 [Shewanella psychrophila]|uniref:Uncharacterized protein n=1 Tax=Shewanella psychrophila TaxID=225848 RepID=A0A1S6HT27_9GAMM|nr:hypothetical protein [Shewanella psychrophila]AQS38618.1 hypothetical protein Sps_03491 [Shewanella psychrophila]
MKKLLIGLMLLPLSTPALAWMDLKFNHSPNNSFEGNSRYTLLCPYPTNNHTPVCSTSEFKSGRVNWNPLDGKEYSRYIIKDDDEFKIAYLDMRDTKQRCTKGNHSGWTWNINVSTAGKNVDFCAVLPGAGTGTPMTHLVADREDGTLVIKMYSDFTSENMIRIRVPELDAYALP